MNSNVEDSEMDSDNASVVEEKLHIVKKEEIKNKIIGVFTEKGGVGKTTVTFLISKSKIFRNLKILLIDLDPQFDLAKCYQPAAILQKMKFYNSSDLIKKKPFENIFRELNVSMIVGKQLDPSDEAFFTTCYERKELSPIKLIHEHLAILTSQFDLVIFDFNPTYSTINKIFLNTCNAIMNLLTPDHFCLSSLNRFFNWKIQNDQKFVIYPVPSLIKFTRPSKPALFHDRFIDRVIAYINEQSVRNDELKYVGVLRRVDNLNVQHPRDYLTTTAIRLQEVNTMIGELNDILIKVVTNTSDELDGLTKPYLWEPYDNNDVKSGESVLYVLKSNNQYKVGKSKKPLNRVKEIMSLTKKDWTIYKAFRSYKETVSAIENKIKSQYGDGEFIEGSVFIETLLNNLIDYEFIVNLIIE